MAVWGYMMVLGQVSKTPTLHSVPHVEAALPWNGSGAYGLGLLVVGVKRHQHPTANLELSASNPKPCTLGV